MSLGGVLSFMRILFIVISMVLRRLSILESDEEVEGMVSSLYVTLFSDLSLALFSIKLASTLIAHFCMSSRVRGSLSLS